VCVHSKVLSEHYVDCTGSRYERAYFVPNVYLLDDLPELHWNIVGHSFDGWGSASCRSRA